MRGPGKKFCFFHVFRGIFARRIQPANLFWAYSSFSLIFEPFLRDALARAANGQQIRIQRGRKPRLAY